MWQSIFVMEHTELQKAHFFLGSIYKKAWQDKTFLKNLVSNPIETLNNFTKRKGKLPNGKVLVVEDQTNPNHIFLNIPAKPANYRSEKLDEEQLNNITGAFFSSSNSRRHLFLSLKTELRNLFDN